jgi:hypothetical protein
MRQIKIIVPLKGVASGKAPVSFETSGFQGTACKDATAAISRMFANVVADEAKSEMFEDNEQREHISGE